MFSGQQFYYRTIRRNVIAFGSMFKDIQLVTYTNDTAHTELKRVRVPLVYGDKEDYYIRLKSAPNMPIPSDLPLPRMMFRMTGLGYDATRKQQSQLQQYAQSGSGVATQYIATPYNMDFLLEIYVRNTEDGCQIVEQILPYFTPEYTMTMVFVDELGLTKNVPVVLNNVSRSLDNEGATDWTMRREVWSLNFTMQTYMFGPTAQGGLITQANTNIWYYSGISQIAGQGLHITLGGPGFLSYQIGEVVYQGPSLQQATAVGTVEAFNATANLLIIQEKSGTWLADLNVHGANTSASWNVVSMPLPVPLATVIDTVIPANANVGDDFGFTVTIIETPKTFS